MLFLYVKKMEKSLHIINQNRKGNLRMFSDMKPAERRLLEACQKEEMLFLGRTPNRKNS